MKKENFDYQQIIEDCYHAVQKMQLRGKVASYIPELTRVNPHLFGVSLIDMNGNIYEYGDSRIPFSIQSISKVHTLVLVYRQLKSELWDKVNVEPSGNPYNSFAQLEFEKGIPRNPFINPGALVITDQIMSLYHDDKLAVLEFIAGLCGAEAISVNKSVQQSEMDCSNLNRAVAYLLKSHGNLIHDVDDVIEAYTHHCAIEMDCTQLAKSFLYLANNGRCIFSKQSIIPRNLTQRINALMLTCGFYDQAGEFAFRVGLAGKSGVGGGVVAVLPGHFSITVFSPMLNEKGNPKKAVHFLEKFTTKMGISLF